MLETLALCAGLWVVALFLPVGGSVANRMEKVTWCWGIEVHRCHSEQNLQVTLRKASYSETFSSDTCTVGKGDHTTPTNTVEVTDVSEKEESVLDQTRKPLCKYRKTERTFWPSQHYWNYESPDEKQVRNAKTKSAFSPARCMFLKSHVEGIFLQ